MTVLWTPSIRFGSIAWQSRDAAGVEWYCESLEGWHGNPPSDAPALRRVQDHGVWSMQGWYAGRALTLTGSIVAPSAAALSAALHRLTAVHAAALAEEVELTVDELDGPKTLIVRAGSPAMAVTMVGRDACRVSFEVLAPWPIKRGPLRTAPLEQFQRGVGWRYPRGANRHYGAPGFSGTSVDIAGNAICRPRFQILGPAHSPTITSLDQGRHLHFEYDLASGDRLIADAASRSVVLNNVSNRRFVLSADSVWFDLHPGENRLAYTDGQVSLTSHDAWW